MMKRKDQAILGEALGLARELEGATAPKWVLMEALAAEFIGSFASVLAAADRVEFAEGAGVEGERKESRESAGFGTERVGPDGAAVPSSEVTGLQAQMSGDGQDAQMSGNEQNAQMSGGSSTSRLIHPRRTSFRVERLTPAWVEECCEYLKECEGSL